MKQCPIDVEAPQIEGNAVADANMAKKFKRKRQKLLITELLMDFSKNTSLHGLKYINEKGVSTIEKLFWLFTFVGSVGLCVFLISNVFYKWRNSPVIVSFSEKMVPVEKVPLPSVTICPQWKCMKTRYNYSDMIMKREKDLLSAAEEARLEDISFLCDDTLVEVDRGPLRNKTLVEHIIQVSPTLKDIGRDSRLKRVLTDQGVCYNYNSLAAEEIFNKDSVQKDYVYLDNNMTTRGWTLKDGYTDQYETKYPRRGVGNGAEPDVQLFLLSSFQDFDETCNPLNNGFKIYLHHPADLPHSSLYYYAALPGQMSSMALKFNSIHTSKRLQGYSISERQCYFPKDRLLRYFKIYTQKNCMIECRSNFTFARCGCVSYEMPHNDSTQLCSFGNKHCVALAKEDLTIREMKALDNPEEASDACNCLPACDSITYEAEILKTEFNVKRWFKNMDKIYSSNDSNFLKGYKISAVELYFREPQFVSMRRSELFGTSDFLANCGGLLGLFLGFSFLSLVEIFYFITLRFCCILRKDAVEDTRNDKQS